MIRQNTTLPALWDTHRVDVVTGVALLLPIIVMITQRGIPVITPLLLAIAVVAFWQFVFAKLEGRTIGLDGFTTALIFALLLPDTVPLWQQGLALSFGVVMGDLIFGERGRGFLNPVVVGLAFLLFSFPVTAVVTPSLAVAIASAVAGAVLLMTGLLSWRIIVSFLVVITLMVLVFPVAGGWKVLLGASLMPALIFLIGDPVAAACTNAGRWIYGGLSGGLVVLLGANGAGAGSLSSMVFAALLASIFAPLIDQAVIWANVRRRMRRQVS